MMTLRKIATAAPPPRIPPLSHELLERGRRAHEKFMTLRKIADLPQPCFHPEHNPPTMIVLEPGVYEHTCPNCGAVTTFRVERPYMVNSLGCSTGCPPDGCERHTHVHWTISTTM